MKGMYEYTHQKKKIGEEFSEENLAEKMIDPIEKQAEIPVEEIAEEPAEILEEKIGIEPVQEEAIVLRPSKTSHRTIRERRKIGQELIEKGIEEQKAGIKDQIDQLPKERRKAFLEELLESMNQ